jgi:hypothetical protein
MIEMSVAAESQCSFCNEGRKPYRYGYQWIHPGPVPCANYDSELRHVSEAFGLYVFAWLPKRCRNGRLRWLTWLEQHRNGTFTLGNRAY